MDPVTILEEPSRFRFAVRVAAHNIVVDDEKRRNKASAAAQAAASRRARSGRRP